MPPSHRGLPWPPYLEQVVLHSSYCYHHHHFTAIIITVILLWLFKAQLRCRLLWDALCGPYLPLKCCDLSCGYYGLRSEETIGLEFRGKLEKLSQPRFWILREGYKGENGLQNKERQMMISSFLHLLFSLLKCIAVCLYLLIWKYNSYCLVLTNLILTIRTNSLKNFLQK